MKKIILFIAAICVSSAFSTDTCYTQNDQGMPAGSCTQIGYVCGLGFHESNGKNVMFVNLGTDTTCSILMTSKLKTYTYPGSATYSPYLKLFLIEDEFNASPLSLTLAGSLALSASNNKEPVYVIYKQDHDIEFGGIKLQSINKVK
jgi:hypothetical protein